MRRSNGAGTVAYRRWAGRQAEHDEKSKRRCTETSVLVLSAALTGCGPEADLATPAAQAPGGVPTFRVDPTWPREMPNQGIVGAVTAVFVDA